MIENNFGLNPVLEHLLKKAVEDYNKMSPQEKEKMHKAQAKSFGRHNVSIGDPRWD